MSDTAVMAICAAVTLLALTVLWARSVALADTSIVDVYWGAGFGVVGWVAAALGDGWHARAFAVAVLATLWGARLSAHIAVRNRGGDEDPRYAEMRERHGAAWPRRSLFTVFWLQGVVLWVVSLPLQAAAIDRSPAHVTALDVLGVVVWAVGLGFEAIGDRQLARFKADPANKGKLMDRGLWAWTRHPNYFGDACLWWGLGLIAAATGEWWALVGPLAMTIFLTKVSGVAMLEKTMSQRAGWDEYAARTSVFFPLPPKRGR